MCGVVAFYCNDFKTNDAYIAHIHVPSYARGKGIGSLLLFHAFEYAKSWEMKSVVLECEANNISGVCLYHKFRFVPEERYMILGVEYIRMRSTLEDWDFKRISTQDTRE
jgi:ribosomal protein S18 acetylase RimI-like enzyme